MRRWLLALASAALLGGCAAALPPLPERTPSPRGDTSDTRLGRVALAAAAEQPLGQSGVYPLFGALDAFAARALLMRAADRTLDVQYYIWHADTTGALLFDELLRAADRGVQVRLLLDDNGIAGLDPDLAALDAHPNVEVRLFNPFLQRTFKAWGYLSDFQRLNRRMHNKSLTADSQATIVGGRNIGDEYFGADTQFGFADLDVLALGPAAREVSSAFDEYWNSASAYPASTIIGSADAQALKGLAARLDDTRASEGARTYADALARTTFIDRLLERQLELQWVPVRVLYDPPAKVRDEVKEADLLLAGLAREMGAAQRELELVSPYFVPGDAGTAELQRQAARGVRVRIVTNSLAATDVVAVHAGYAKRRAELLRAGVRLFELKPDARAAPSSTPRQSSLTFTGSATASLHGKTFALDREQLFVGSFNFDPRSVRLNTEMGLVIRSRELAGSLAEGLDRVLERAAYEVRVAEDGELEWVERGAAGEVRHRSEPRAGFGRRLGAGLLSILPLESLL